MSRLVSIGKTCERGWDWTWARAVATRMRSIVAKRSENENILVNAFLFLLETNLQIVSLLAVLFSFLFSFLLNFFNLFTSLRL